MDPYEERQRSIFSALSRVQDTTQETHKTEYLSEAPLSTKERKDLPSGEFALPDLRKFPIENADHVKMAWDMVSRAKGLSSGEREEARRHILSKAKSLGIDTAKWDKDESVTFKSFMSILGEEAEKEADFSKLVNKLVKKGMSKADAVAYAMKMGKKGFSKADVAKNPKELKLPSLPTFQEAFSEYILSSILEADEGDPTSSTGGMTQPNAVGPFKRGVVGGSNEKEDSMDAGDRNSMKNLMGLDHTLMDKYRSFSEKVNDPRVKSHLQNELDRRQGHLDAMKELFGEQE